MRRGILLFLKFAITAALLYFAMRKTDFSDLYARLSPSSLYWMAGALLVALVQVVLGAIRWHTISEASGAALPINKAIRFTLIGGFFNQTLPSSIGGDAVRLWLVASSGAGWRAAAHSILIDRAVGLIVLSVMIVASLPWSYHLITDPNGRLALLGVDLAALSCGIGFLLIGFINSATLSRLSIWRHLHACSAVLTGLLRDYRRAPQLIGLSVALHALTAVVAWFVTRAIQAPVEFSQLFLLIPPVLLITMIPISIAGWGLREASMGLAFGYAGLAAGEGVNVSLLLGATYLAAGVLGGLTWVASAEKRKPFPKGEQFAEQDSALDKAV